MKHFSRLLLGVLLVSRFLLLMHVHPAHASDLHSHHAACQVCAHASFLLQPFAVSAQQVLSEKQQTFEVLAYLQDVLSASSVVSQFQSRAPPSA